jgi:hypothetical protein
MSAHRLVRTAPHLISTDRLQLVLAAACALTATPTGLGMAVVVLVVLLARRRARCWVERSVAVRGGVLAPAQRSDVVHAPCHRRQAVARA